MDFWSVMNNVFDIFVVVTQLLSGQKVNVMWQKSWRAAMQWNVAYIPILKGQWIISRTNKMDNKYW